MGKKKFAGKKVLSLFWNKYFITLAAVIVWTGFFDKNDFMSQYELKQKLKQLRTDEKYYLDEITKSKTEMKELRTNPADLEKFAREKYLMKKDNEEIFVIVKDSSKTTKSANTVAAL
ncbi:MAG: septum formation initiator family protein [Bacteroidetes bacterium]|nr:septum formation initiator family protein [Bacteroidota bacterium]